MSDFGNTQQALSDIQVLKQAILRSKNKVALTVDSVDTHLVLNLAAFAIAASVGAGTIIWPEINDDILSLATSPEVRIPALTIVGSGLLALLSVAYGYIYLRARKEQIAFADFSDKYFSYFKNLSALSDIFVKFCATSLLVLAGKPEWIAPLFVLFIGDLVFQGRLLILSPVTSIAFGVTSFAAAAVIFSLGTSSLLAPACVAMLVCGWSLANICKFRSKLSVQG
ncbi:MAG: hypothetical protein WCD70_12610 [Alphaproteobacteria bacterium]